jgi:hypothetical protein
VGGGAVGGLPGGAVHIEGLLEAWGAATLEERHQLLSMMLDGVYVDMTQGLVLGLKPKPEFLPLFNLGEPVTTGDSELVTGGMEQSRSPRLRSHRTLDSIQETWIPTS